MPRASVGPITLEYETSGDPGHPALLLVGGLGQQLIAWDPGFCAALVARGLFVIRYDNRDVGLSTHLNHHGKISFRRLLPPSGQGGLRRFRTRSTTWRQTGSAFWTTSASTPPMWPACRWGE